MLNGIIEIDVHGKNVESAIEEIRKHLNNAKPSVYRIRIIHGYHGGARIREGIREEFSYGREPKVKRITMGNNQGITDALPKGILLNTKDTKFNSMVIGWGALGTVWGKPAFTVYVREHRYTKAAIDAAKEFTISVPLDKPIPSIAKVCGMQSGRDIDKETEAHLTLENPEKINVPGIKEYPLTLECKVLYSQRQELESIPDDIREKMYPQDIDGTSPMANRDAHMMYIGEIVAAYIIK